MTTYYSGVTEGNALDGTKITDPTVIRALAHPARLAIVEHLGSSGAEITATEAAELVGLSPSATSYHLRALAQAGIIHDAPSRGDGRERVYRGPAARHMRVEMERDDDPRTEALKNRLLDVFLARSEARLHQWRANVAQEPDEWYDAAVLHETMLLMTAEELAALANQISELIAPYLRGQRQEDPPDGARVVSLLVRALPQ
jgi:DNA-binding transcriptional ArsR family regulator